MQTDSAAPASTGSRSAAAAHTAILRVAWGGIGFVASVTISRALRPEGRGLYAIAVTVGALAAVAGSLAFHRALQHHWRRGVDDRALAGAGLVAGIGCGAISVAACALLIELWPAVVAPASPGLVWLALAGVPVSVAAANLVALLSLHGRPQAAAAAALWTGAAHVALLLGGAAAGVLSPAWVVGTGTATTLASLPLYLRALPGGWTVSPAVTRLAGRLLRWSARYQPATLAGHLLLRVDVLILAALAGAREVGLYSLAFALAEGILLVAGAVGQAGAGLQAVGDGDDHSTARVARTSFAIAAITGGGLAAVAGVAVPMLFGAAFSASVAPLLALLPGVAALAAREPLELAMSRRDRPGAISVAAAAALAVNLALNLALIPRWGATGAAVASTTAYILQSGILATWLVRGSTLSARDLAPRPGDIVQPLRTLIEAALRRPVR